jgi:DNA transposition AAA+ family ATPase
MNENEVRDFFLRLRESRPDIATENLAGFTTLAPSTVGRFMLGTVPKSSGRVVEEMARLKEQIERGDVLAPGGASGATVIREEHRGHSRRVAKLRGSYVTQTVVSVGEVLNYCWESASVGVCTGDYGVGKTEALEIWRRGEGRKVESVVFEFDIFASANLWLFMQALAEALGVDAHGHSGRLFRSVCQRLNDDPCLLIFDQCEAVAPRVFQAIRQLWDRTREAGVGVVLLSAPILLLRLKQSKMKDLGALESRIGVVAALRGFSKDEMGKILRQEGVMDVEPAAMDLWWRVTGGSMRRLFQMIELVKTKHAGHSISERTIEGMNSLLWGMPAGGRRGKFESQAGTDPSRATEAA